MQQKSKSLLRGIVAFVAIGVLGFTSLPAMAEGARPIEPRTGGNGQEQTVIDGTFAIESEDDDAATLKIGKNLFLAGNNLQENLLTESLLFAAGNTLNLETGSEYGFIAGNTIRFDGVVEKDLFLAGNSITIEDSAIIGRDVFATGNNITLATDLDGDFSAVSNTVTLNNVKIAGNLNLSAARIVFSGEVEVAGQVVYNEDAVVCGLDHLTYGGLEVYEVKEKEVSVAAIWYSKLMSIVSLFVVMAVILLIWRQTPTKVERATNTTTNVAQRLVIGLGILLLTPIIVVLTFMSYALAPVGLLLFAVYMIMIYLSQGFAGLWVGRLILNKLFKIQSNAFVEALVGILLLGICSLIPYLGVLTGFFGLLLGLGLIVDCACRKEKLEETKDTKKLNDRAGSKANQSKKTGGQKDEA